MLLIKNLIFNDATLLLSEVNVRLDNILNNWNKFDTLQDQIEEFVNEKEMESEIFFQR